MPQPRPHSGRPRPLGGSSYLDSIRSTFGTRMVKVVRNPGAEDEESFDVEAHIQQRFASFEADTPIYTGDYVELPDPRGGPAGVELRYVARATVLQSSPEPSMHRVKVEWGDPPDRIEAAASPLAARRLSIEGFHSHVQAAAGRLFAGDHYEAAVAEAFKSVEVRVRTITQIEQSGVRLMGEAFRPDGAVLDTAQHTGRTGQDEREGFLALFRGAMLAIRNRAAHEPFKDGNSSPRAVEQVEELALEHLALASLLHRRIDIAEAKRSPTDDM